MHYETHLGCQVERKVAHHASGQTLEHITLSGPDVLRATVARVRLGSAIPQRERNNGHP